MAYASLFKSKKDPSRASFLALLYLGFFISFFGAAPPCGRVGLCRSSQVCSALQPPAAAWVWPSGPLLSIPQPAALRACKPQRV